MKKDGGGKETEFSFSSDLILYNALSCIIYHVVVILRISSLYQILSEAVSFLIGAINSHDLFYFQRHMKSSRVELK
jgi:hypothetical protein